MFKSLSSLRLLLLVLASNIIVQGFYWLGWAWLDYCCRSAVNNMFGTALDFLKEWQQPITYGLGGALAIVLIANIPRFMAMAKKFLAIIKNVSIGGTNGGSWAEGIRVEGAPARIDSVQIEAAKRGLTLSNAAESEVTNTTVRAVGADDSSVGFDIRNSPGSKLPRAKAKGYVQGFRIDNSPDTDLTDAVAARHSDKPED